MLCWSRGKLSRRKGVGKRRELGFKREGGSRSGGVHALVRNVINC